jgi:hypothetical protein
VELRGLSGKRTLSLDMADFRSLMLKKAAPRRCLSESPRSLKDMLGGRGRGDDKAGVGERIGSSAGCLLMCLGRVEGCEGSSRWVGSEGRYCSFP